jgi:hypothetical protein
MSDLSLVEDEDIEIPGGDEDGEGNEAEGDADGDEGQGQEDDAGEEDDEGEGQEGHVAARSPRQGRAAESVRLAKAEAKEAKDRADRLEREIAEIRQLQTAPRQPTAQEIAAEAAQEAERLALMAPHEQVQYLVAKEMNKVNARLHQTQMTLAEETDRAAFRSLQTSNPLARKYATDVEKVVSDQKARGFTVDRETALKHVLGTRLFEQSMKNAGKAKKAGASRIAAAQGRPGRAAGEAGSDRGGRRGDDSIEALERRLAGVKF